MTNLNDTIQEGLDKYGTTSGGWFKFEDGDNKMRVLTMPAVMGQHFSPGGYKGICIGAEDNCEGCKEETKATPRWLTWILDYKDNELKLIKFPYKIIKSLGEYQNNEEYAFETFPMPYDINITAENAGTTDVVYTIIPARNESEVSKEALEALEKEGKPEDIVEKMKEKVRGGDKKKD